MSSEVAVCSETLPQNNQTLRHLLNKLTANSPLKERNRYKHYPDIIQACIALQFLCYNLCNRFAFCPTFLLSLSRELLKLNSFLKRGFATEKKLSFLRADSMCFIRVVLYKLEKLVQKFKIQCREYVLFELNSYKSKYQTLESKPSAFFVL
jgi:hypothetical protein